MKKLFSFALITCYSFLAFSAPDQAPKKIKVGVSPVVTSSGLFLAYEKGYFKDEGLDIELVQMKSSGAQMTLLLSKGELDVGGGNLTAGLYKAIADGLNFKIVADKGHVDETIDSVSLIIRKDLITSGKYKSPKDLKGLKIALTSIDGSSQQIVMDQILKDAGLNGKDVEYVKLSYPESNAALKTKAIDGVIQLDPYLTMAINDGYAEEVIASNKVLKNQQSGALFYSPEFIKNKTAAQKFMKSYLKGVRLYNQALTDKNLMSEVTQSLKKHIEITDEKIWQNLRKVGLTNDGKLNTDSMLSDIKWYHDNGYLEKTPTLEQFLDSKFAEAATAELDKKVKKTTSKKNKGT
jgi:NitT/TauT family transport system substrate-binding protein